MAETFCGKSCTQCTERQENGCPGCRAGHGAWLGGDCEIAQCARERGHESCDTCTHRAGCGKMVHADTMPQNRKRKQEQERQLQQQTKEKTKGIGKWLWLIFWLVIPGGIGGLMSDENIVQALPGLYLPGVILGAAVSAVYGIALLMLRKRAEGYCAAGICRLVISAVNLIAQLVFVRDNPWILALLIPAAIVSLVAERQEYIGHAALLINVDDELSDKWDNLWKWFLYSLVAVIAGTLLLWILLWLGALLIVAGAVGTVVVQVFKLVYLYRTAQAVG